MTDPGAEGVAEVGPPTPRRRFSIPVTLVCSLVVAIYVGLPLGSLVRDSSPLAQLDRPEDSLERLVTRELDLREAIRHGLDWEWRLYRVLSGVEDPAREAGGWYEELADTLDSNAVELHRAVLLAESGETDRVREVIARWKERGEPALRMANWVSAAYLGIPPGAEDGRTMIAEIRDTLEPGWFADTLTERIAARIGDADARSRAEAAIVARGQVLERRLRLLMALVIALLVAGMLALVWMLARRSPARVAGAPLPPDWSSADGYALFVRALGAPQAIIVTLYFFLPRASRFETVLAMAADLLVFWWIVRYLRGRERSVPAAFGLLPRRDDWPRVFGVTLILIALALVADTVIGTAGDLVGLKAHWADGFSEDLLWDPHWAFVGNVLDATVWAPVIEELTFRGLLYATLRTRLGVWPAALVSAAVFALPHGYAAAGSLSVLVSGVLWAWSYERTRSLVPGLFAHSANNLMSTLWVVALLRL